MARATLALLQKRKDEMATLHDTLLAAIRDARESVRSLAAEVQELRAENQQMQDVLAEAQALKAEADKAAKPFEPSGQ